MANRPVEQAFPPDNLLSLAECFMSVVKVEDVEEDEAEDKVAVKSMLVRIHRRAIG